MGAGLGEEKGKKEGSPHLLLLAGLRFSVLWRERGVTLGCLLPVLSARVPDSKQKWETEEAHYCLWVFSKFYSPLLFASCYLFESSGSCLLHFPQSFGLYSVGENRLLRWACSIMARPRTEVGGRFVKMHSLDLHNNPVGWVALPHFTDEDTEAQRGEVRI